MSFLWLADLSACDSKSQSRQAQHNQAIGLGNRDYVDSQTFKPRPRLDNEIKYPLTKTKFTRIVISRYRLPIKTYQSRYVSWRQRQ